MKHKQITIGIAAAMVMGDCYIHMRVSVHRWARTHSHFISVGERPFCLHDLVEEQKEKVKNASLSQLVLLAKLTDSFRRKAMRSLKKIISGVEKVEKEKKIKLSNVETCVLQMLIANRGVNYAYGLVDKSQGLLNRNGIYTTLARMELKGLIESEQEEVRPGAKGKPRRIYKTTGIGQRVFTETQERRSAFDANWSII